MKRLITVADIAEGLASDGGSIYLEEDVIITPLARDRVKEMGLSLVVGRPPEAETQAAAAGGGEGTGPEPDVCGTPDRNPDEGFIGSVVAAVLTRLGRDGRCSGATDPSGVRVVNPDGLAYVPLAEAGGRGRVRARQIFAGGENSAPACGLWVLEDTSFTLQTIYAQIFLVLAGQVNLHIEDRSYTAREGDVFFLPQNVALRLECPDWARLFYVNGQVSRKS